MTKFKSGIITVIAGVLLFCVLYLSDCYDYHWYKTLQTIFATYGELMSLVVLYKWLRQPSMDVDPKHLDITVASGETIPKGWLDPFKLVKEKKNGQTVADKNGLQNAGHSENRPGNVSGRPVASVRNSSGANPEHSVSQNSTLVGEPESA